MPGNKKDYHRRKSLGLCVVCGDKAASESLYCETCKDRERESRHRRMQDVTNRFCACGNPAHRMLSHSEGICERCDAIEKRIYQSTHSRVGRRQNLLNLSPMPI
jgi:hypothetical protein